MLPCVNELKPFSLEHYFKPHLPTILLSAEPAHCEVAHMPTSTQVTTVNLPVSTKKESVKPVYPDVLRAASSITQMISIISTKKQPTGTKRKQIRIDMLLPKKRVCEMQTSALSHGDSPSTSQAISFPNVTHTTEKLILKQNASLPESKKYDILFRHWKPESDYSFPPDENTGRRFQYECLT